MADAKAVWVPLAREALVRTAHEYHRLIKYGELAEEIQQRSGIRTKQLVHYCIGDILGQVATDCHERQEPLLSALCVQQNGSIGDGYAVALAATYGGSPPDDLDMSAAEERLACYRFFGATIPDDGGRPALPPQVALQRRK